MAKILPQIEEHNISNLRLFAGDAAELLAGMRPASFARIDLIHPDPWPKRRHWKRRFVQDATIAAMSRAPDPRWRISLCRRHRRPLARDPGPHGAFARFLAGPPNVRMTGACQGRGVYGDWLWSEGGNAQVVAAPTRCRSCRKKRAQRSDSIIRIPFGRHLLRMVESKDHQQIKFLVEFWI